MGIEEGGDGGKVLILRFKEDCEGEKLLVVEL